MTSTDKENTIRILKGQDPIQKFRCRLGIHRWTAWEHQPAVSNRNTFESNPEYIRCNCADCGLVRVERPYSKTLFGKKN